MEVAHNFTDKQERSHPGASTMMYTVPWTEEWHCTWMNSEGEGMSVGTCSRSQQGPTRVNSDVNRVTQDDNSSVNLASHGHCAGVFIGT
jgi:hypothetical protein